MPLKRSRLDDSVSQHAKRSRIDTAKSPSAIDTIPPPTPNDSEFDIELSDPKNDVNVAANPATAEESAVHVQADEDQIDWSDAALSSPEIDPKTSMGNLQSVAATCSIPAQALHAAGAHDPAVDIHNGGNETTAEVNEAQFAAEVQMARTCLFQMLEQQFRMVPQLPQSLGLNYVNDYAEFEFAHQGVRYNIGIEVTGKDETAMAEQYASNIESTAYPAVDEETPIQSIEKSRTNSLADAPPLTTVNNHFKKPCKFGNNCKKSDACPFDHSRDIGAKLCLWVNTRSGCLKGKACTRSHKKAGIPCRESETRMRCPLGKSCAYFHKNDKKQDFPSTSAAEWIGTSSQSAGDTAFTQAMLDMPTNSPPVDSRGDPYHGGTYLQQRGRVAHFSRGRGRGRDSGRGGGGDEYRQTPYNRDTRGRGRNVAGGDFRGQQREQSSPGIQVKGAAERRASGG